MQQYYSYKKNVDFKSTFFYYLSAAIIAIAIILTTNGPNIDNIKPITAFVVSDFFAAFRIFFANIDYLKIRLSSRRKSSMPTY